MDFIFSDLGLMAAAAAKAFATLMEPHRLMYLCLGCVLGLVLGIIPGIGGLAGTAMLLPFTFTMDPYSAFALLLGLGATTATGDPIPAVLFGIPGGAASAATVLDGHPMAKRGEAGRALSAAYMSSMIGGIFGAALLAFTVPILRPVMLYLGSPELLAFSVLGISMVAVLSGSAPLRGLAAACIGIMIAMVGVDANTSTPRWTFDSLYLWEGLPLTPLLLGIFALPELCDLLISRVAIAQNVDKASIYRGQWQGVKDCMQNWWLILRCSWIGGGIGSIPGISASVVDWLAYGHALKTEKGAAQTFGRGDVRGVIASESSNNAKEGGALVPTLAFGVPGSATMAILLGAFLVHGLVPGPDMLTKNLDITYAMVWSIALANILGAGACYAFSPQFAKLATLRYSLILPGVLCVIFLGAYEASKSWGDLYILISCGIIGWLMKQAKWPRAPLILGLVLGDSVERYMFISVERYGASFLLRPVVAALLLFALISLIRPFIQDVRRHGGWRGLLLDFGAPRFQWMQLFTIASVAALAVVLVSTSEWPLRAKLVPIIVGTLGLVAASLSLFDDLFRKPRAARPDDETDVLDLDDANAPAQAIPYDQNAKIHMDLTSDTGDLRVATIYSRAARFFGYLLGLLVGTAVIGLIPASALFVVAFMRLEAQEKWSIVIPYAVLLALGIYVVSTLVMETVWPSTLLGDIFPWLRIIPSV